MYDTIPNAPESVRYISEMQSVKSVIALLFLTMAFMVSAVTVRQSVPGFPPGTRTSPPCQTDADCPTGMECARTVVAGNNCVTRTRTGPVGPFTLGPECRSDAECAGPRTCQQTGVIGFRCLFPSN